MTKSSTEKKRIRRPPSAAGRDLSDSQSKDLYQVFAEKVRDNKQLKSKWAIMQETRVEYFRGKDFQKFLIEHPEALEVLGPDKDLDAEDIINTLLRKSLIIRCDRVVKTVRPGKKKLSSWPGHLEIHLEQAFAKEDAFFAWTFMKRRALWQTILSFLWPLVALAMCLFPVYPYQVKIVVLYSCAGALLFIVTLLLIRAAIFGALFIILGKRIWFFPNINAEETTFRELVRFWPKKEEGESPKWTSRLFYAIISVLLILLLRHHAPDEAARARYQSKVSNIIDEMLEWSPKLALSGMLEKHPSAVNASEKSRTMDGTWGGPEEKAADHKSSAEAESGLEGQEMEGDVDDEGNVR
ncbi:hypothetical protein HPP92_024875 [Vanilla planifolia]|uniref:Translocation protein SEC62 n=1 Tax=Vanilla planifolia TaxID=51239 RepID=A0A835PQP3_VANPL|nr:hypothetical protein HPP92_024875 [Vanilla planifolia]